jgi:hypothetical protein
MNRSALSAWPLHPDSDVVREPAERGAPTVGKIVSPRRRNPQMRAHPDFSTHDFLLLIIYLSTSYGFIRNAILLFVLSGLQLAV